MIGQTVSHYRITEKLGEGGMGEVYLAEDTSLKRQVALKFLPERLQQDETAHKRFLREAESAAALEHPYICNIKEVAQAKDGQDFIVMEYVEGQSLKERLAEGPLTIGEAARIALEVAEALELAHERGIVHRDLKPANIMLTLQGHAKVMDFGLAKQVAGTAGGEQEITTALTREGATLGTLAYMSPEQLRGQAVDPRSDIFAFGIVLYEMLSGVHPFLKGQPTETVSALLTADPPPLKHYLGTVPELLQQTVRKMLAKDPKERYQSIHEVATNLSDPSAPWKAPRWPTRLGIRFWGLAALLLAVVVVVALLGWWALREERTGGGGPVINSIVVLPLANMSGDPEQEYFADGMTDALITDLAKIGTLKVIARSSAMLYKGANKPLQEIARELGVEAIVEGSVLREGNQVGISAQLIEAATGQNLWADRYERDLTSILALHGEVAQAIAREIQVTLTPGEEALLTRTRTVNPEAYKAFLKGQSHWGKFTRPELETALQYYNLSLEKDPNYAPAYAGISLAWAGLQQMGWVRPDEAGPKAREAAQKAIELDGTSVEAHYSLAIVRGWTDWDWQGAEEAFLRAIELNPNYPDVRAFYSHYLMIMKRPDQAMAQVNRALELDPFNVMFQGFHAVVLRSMGRYDEAIEVNRDMLNTVPNHPMALQGLRLAYYQKGMYEESYEAAKAQFTASGTPEAVEVLERGYTEGDFKGAMSRLADWHAAYFPSGHADFFVMAGKNQQALDRLEDDVEEREPNLAYICVESVFNGLYGEPRFENVLRRMNFPEDVIARILNEDP